MLIHEKLYSKVKGNVLFVYGPVTKHPNVNQTNKRYKCGSRHHLSICDFHFMCEEKTDEDNSFR